MSPKQHQEMMQREREAQIEEANKRIAAANERIALATGVEETESTESIEA